MRWQFTEDKPIYVQIIERIELGIAAGEFAAGEKLLSVRDLASEAGVNPNTMQRAFAELERYGLVYSERTSGRYITTDTALIERVRENMASKQVTQFLNVMRQLGIDEKKTVEMLEKRIREGALEAPISEGE